MTEFNVRQTLADYYSLNIDSIKYHEENDQDCEYYSVPPIPVNSKNAVWLKIEVSRNEVAAYLCTRYYQNRNGAGSLDICISKWYTTKNLFKQKSELLELLNYMRDDIEELGTDLKKLKK